jgi:hypothetical protein
MRCEYKLLRNFGLFVVTGFFFAAAAGAQTQRAVLVRGNEWRAGIPGFGNNIFSSLFGEYRVETSSGENGPLREQAASTESGASASSQPAPQPGAAFFVRVSGETLLFDRGIWQSRPGPSPALQREESGSLLVAIPFSGGADLGSWTILFQFPSEPGHAGLNETSADSLMNAWVRRFRYFLSLVKNASDISLPAVVEF